MYYLNNMNRIIIYLKNNKKFFIIFFVIILFFIIISNKKNETSAPVDSPLPKNVASYNELVPGINSKEDVFSKMGTALNAKIEDNKETYEYLSSNPNFNSEVVILDNKLEYLKIIYTNKDNKNYEDFVSLYGNPEKILYNSEYSVGYVLNAYPNKGIAFISHINSKKVSEVWYFKSTPLEEFMNTFAVGYYNKPNLSR